MQIMQLLSAAKWRTYFSLQALKEVGRCSFIIYDRDFHIRWQFLYFPFFFQELTKRKRDLFPHKY